MKLVLDLAQIHLDENSNISNRSMNTARNPKSKVSLNLLQNCLDSLDLFKVLLEGIPQMKNRVIRDVRKSVDVLQFNEGDTIYDIGEKATGVYFCLKGSVAICIPSQKTARNQASARNQSIQQNKSHNKQQTQNGQNNEKQYEEIDIVQVGQGFGQAQFIAQKKRTVKASAKQQYTQIGKLQLDSVQEVIQNYKMRVYYKKRDMFQKCPLFQGMSEQKLQFIINNTKVMKLKISNKLINEGEMANVFYLINKGKIKTWKSSNQQVYSLKRQFSSQSKYMIPRKATSTKIIGGLLEQGHFIGDRQIALNCNHHCFTYQAITEQVQLYYCDHRIVLSQMNHEELTQVAEYYQQREIQFGEKVKKFKKISKNLDVQRQKDLQKPLTLDQIKLKRKLLRRHFEKKPSLIGCSSPIDIGKMIDRKKSRVAQSMKESSLPSIQVFSSHSMKKRSYNKVSFSPIPIVSSSTPTKKIRTEGTQCQSPLAFNPQQQQSDTKMEKAKSMMIQIKNSKSINLSKVKHYQQPSMAVVGKVLGQYNNIKGIYSLNSIIESIRKKNY